MSCASAGNCAAGGRYRDGGHLQGFVAGERNGLWGKAIEVPGLAALNARRGRRGHLGVVRLGGQLRGRRVLPPAADITRGSWPPSGTAAGARRSRCPAWRP